jgi:hypothetical protein
MTPNKRAELLSEIEELRKQQLEFSRQATFGGWTREVDEAHERRAERIAALCRQLYAPDGTDGV